MLRLELMALDGGKESRGNGVGARLPVPLAIDDVAPPLQADFAGQSLARHVTNPRHFEVECMECVQGAAAIRRRKQRCDEAVAVGSSDQLGAMGKRILHGRQLIRIGA